MLKRQSYFFMQSSAMSAFCLLALTLSRSLARPIRDDNPILGFSDQVRIRHLYTNNDRINLHLQITPEGEVSGTEDKNLYSLLEMKAVKPSILVIKGMKSTRYLCMDSRHHLYGSKIYKDGDCNFREVPLADGYNLYYSEKYPAPLTLTPMREGHPSGKQMAQFMPLESTIPLEELYVADDYYDQHQGSHFHIEDPFGMKDPSSIYSPSLDE